MAITVTVHYFAAVRERLGRERDELTLDDGADLADLWATLVTAHPSLDGLRAHLRLAVNLEFAPDDQRLNQGDEIALIPPVSGGSDRCRVIDTALDTEAVRRVVERPEAGAVVTFEGVVRDHTGPRRVERLHYECYPAMALAKLEEVADAVERDWPQARVAVHHRYGEMAIGEVAVAIAVSSPHRREAFEACAAVIDRLKQEVPIWKKEIGPEGESWVGWGP